MQRFGGIIKRICTVSIVGRFCSDSTTHVSSGVITGFMVASSNCETKVAGKSIGTGVCITSLGF